jgi:hypothetical protein
MLSPSQSNFEPGTFELGKGRDKKHKEYRPPGEGISSSRGRNIVLPGKEYRPPGERISSSRGKNIVLPGKFSFVIYCLIISYRRYILCTTRIVLKTTTRGDRAL